MIRMRTFILSTALLIIPSAFAAVHPAQNYIYFPDRGVNGSAIIADRALTDPRFSGAQIVYTWRSLEPGKGHYDFSAIRQDLGYLHSINRKLWIQLQEKSFQPGIKNVPDYLLVDPLYKGGVLKQSMLTAPERDPHKSASDDEYGWAAKIWEKPVRDRFQSLIVALGREFDGKIEGINFSESSIETGTEQSDGTTVFTGDFNPQKYVDAIRSDMQVLSKAFRQSVPMVYLNFLPGEWLPLEDKGYMSGLFSEARKLNMGIGGPDLMPYRKSHMTQTYPFFKDYPDNLVKGMAVQEGNLRQVNPETGKKNTVADIIKFARDYLSLDYIFWVEDEPGFSQEVLKQLP